MIIIFSTAPTIEEAEQLARAIVGARLAACVQVLPKMKSFYVWEGEMQTDDEFLMLIKTADDKFDAVRGFIESNHSYETPEIVAVKPLDVSAAYLDWLNRVVQ